MVRAAAPLRRNDSLRSVEAKCGGPEGQACGNRGAREVWQLERDSPLHVGVLLALFAIAASSYVHFVIHVVRECCAILDIHCFTLKKKPPKRSD